MKKKKRELTKDELFEICLWKNFLDSLLLASDNLFRLSITYEKIERLER